MNRAVRKLIASARKAHEPSNCADASARAEEPPFGFSTRVAARWAAEGRRPSVADVWRRLCWWGATVSVMICLASAAYRATLPEATVFDALLEEPVTETDMF